MLKVLFLYATLLCCLTIWRIINELRGDRLKKAVRIEYCQILLGLNTAYLYVMYSTRLMKEIEVRDVLNELNLILKSIGYSVIFAGITTTCISIWVLMKIIKSNKKTYEILEKANKENKRD